MSERLPAAVTFDFWNTLAYDPEGLLADLRLQALVPAIAGSGVDVEQEELALRLSEIGAAHQTAWEAGRLFVPDDAARMLVEALDVPDQARDAVAEAFLSAGRNAPLELAPDVGDALAALDDLGVRLGIVCDVGFTPGAVLRDFLDQKGLLERFSGWSFSDEVGYYKPSPETFRHALDELGAEPEYAIHVGDLRRTDVAGARLLGMGTVRYRGLFDDTAPAGADGARDADHVIDAHAELPMLLGGRS